MSSLSTLVEALVEAEKADKADKASKYSSKQMLFPVAFPSDKKKDKKYEPPPKWESAGGVVLSEDRQRVYVRKPSNNYGPWAFAKGQIDKGESAEQAAIREVYEEIGIEARMVPNGQLGRYEGGYSYTTYFVMIAERDTGRHDKETKEVRLVPPAEAMRLFAKGGNKRDIEVLKKALPFFASAES